MKYWCVPISLALAGFLTVRAGAQVPAQVPPAPPLLAPTQSVTPRPALTMQQLMRAIIFPNANVVFAAQLTDPASIARDARPSMSTDPLTGLYGGWQAIENSGLALADAADLLNTRGRVCADGRPVPIEDAAWKSAVEGLRESALIVAAAARARNQASVGELSEQLTNTCSGCHRAYRVRESPCVAAR